MSVFRIKAVILTLFLGVFLFTFSGCKVDGEDVTDNPVPVLDGLSPSSKTTHMPTFTLTVNGSGFIASSRIIFNGVSKTTEYVSTTVLTCQIEPGDLPTGGPAAGSAYSGTQSASITVPVLVRNPAPGGGDSGSLNFNVRIQHEFTVPAAIPTGSASSLNPAVAIDDNGRLSVLYEARNIDSTVFSIDYIRSDDSGSTWSGPVKLVESSISAHEPRIALDSEGNINVTFYAAGQLYFLRSTDDGVSWSFPIALSPVTAEILESSIVVDNGDSINVIWPQRDANFNFPIQFVRSTDNGATWSAPVNIFPSFENYRAVYHPVLAADNDGGFFAAWMSWPVGGSRYGDVLTNYSHDNGANWSTDDTRFNVCSWADIAVNPNGDVDLLLASSYLPFADQIVFHQSIDRGVSWSAEIDVTADGFDSRPAVAVDSIDNVNVIYFNSIGCHFNRSIDGGVTWGTSVLLVGNHAGAAGMVVDNQGNIYIVYEDGNTSQLSLITSVK
jgi:hypothetical protein